MHLWDYWLKTTLFQISVLTTSHALFSAMPAPIDFKFSGGILDTMTPPLPLFSKISMLLFNPSQHLQVFMF